jgi:hypothetical protein
VLARVPEADVQRLGINAIAVGQVGIGPIQIGELVLADLDVDLSMGQAELRNFRVTVGLAMTLDWRVRIEIPVLEDIDKSGSVDLGRHSFTLELGDCTIPGLETASLDIARLTATGIAATATPLPNVRLGSAVAENGRARNLVLPSQGFQIAGLSIGSLGAKGISVPAASIDELTIGRLHGEALPVGGITIANPGLPSASVADILSQSVDVGGRQVGTAFHMDCGILDLTLTVVPDARAQIDQLRLGGIQARTGIGQIELRDVSAPYELLNLTLSQIGIESITIPAFTVS